VEMRAGGPDDAEGVGLVHAVSRAAAYAGLVPADALARVTPVSQADYWRTRLATERDPHWVHVVTVDGRIEGFTHGSADGDTATLNALHVLPPLHGTGTGQPLHDRLLADFAGWGCRTAVLWVLEGNERAQSFYRRNRWTSDGGRTLHQVGGVDVPAIRYRRPITN
jgi:GNAT superfamily N-acetyltransferase